jgi:hypothetical protein
MLFLIAPAVEAVHSVVEILGWPTLLATIVWVVRKWDKLTGELRSIDKRTQDNLVTTTVVKAAVETIRDNHLAHVEQGVKDLASSHDKTIEVLGSIDKNIALLVDRFPRA